MEVLLPAAAHVEMEVLVTTATTAKEVGKYVVKVHVVELLVAPRLTVALLVLSDALFALLVVNTALLFV